MREAYDLTPHALSPCNVWIAAYSAANRTGFGKIWSAPHLLGEGVQVPAVHRGSPCDGDDLEGGTDSPQRRNSLEAILARHQEVREHQIHGRRLTHASPRLSITGLEDRVGRRFQQLPQCRSECRFIIDKEHGGHGDSPSNAGRGTHDPRYAHTRLHIGVVVACQAR
jgi:hypothetical protein